MVYWLRVAERQLDAQRLLSHAIVIRQRGQWSPELCKCTMYSACFLLERMVLSFNLRSASTLTASLRQAFRLLPPSWRSSLQQVMTGSGVSDADVSLASASMVGRARLTIDIAFMLYQRSKCNEPLSSSPLPVFFCIIDSSPQGGRKLLLTEVQSFEGSLLLDAAVAAPQMANNVVHDLRDCQRHDNLMDRISTAYSCHTLPLLALGHDNLNWR